MRREARRALQIHGRQSGNVAEFGSGTNTRPSSRRHPRGREGEGTIHIAFEQRPMADGERAEPPRWPGERALRLVDDDLS